MLNGSAGEIKQLTCYANAGYSLFTGELSSALFFELVWQAQCQQWVGTVYLCLK